jgi:hypothetical protein
LCQEYIDNFLDNEHGEADVERGDSVLDSLKPVIGMTFKTREEAQNYFNIYAFAAGLFGCYSIYLPDHKQEEA